MRALGASRTSLVPGGVLAGPWVRDDLWRRARAVPSLDLRFADNKSLVDAVTGASLVTFTRASNGTYTDSAGVLQTAATDVPRFDHNPITGESLGLLVEEQRQNLLLRSEEFDNAGWIKGGLTITTNQEIAPDGLLTADTCTLTASGHALYRFVTVTASTTYTLSFYAKRGTGTTATYSVINDTAGGNIVASTSYYLQTSSSLWSRISVTFTTPAGCTSIGVFLQRDSGSSSGTMFFWGAQLEAGAFPTSYIKNVDTAAGVTRNADVASITGSAFTSFYNQSEGAMFASGDFANAGAGSFSRIISLVGANTGTDEISFYTRISIGAGDGSIFGAVTVNSSLEGDLAAPIGQPDLSGRYRSAIAYKANDFGLSSNGLTPTVDTSGTLPTITQLIIMGNVRFQNRLSGHIRRLTYWPVRLGNNVLQQVTQ